MKINTALLSDLPDMDPSVVKQAQRMLELLIELDHSEGAIPNRARVCKANTETSDSLPDGALGTVLSSFNVVNDSGEQAILYAIEWDAAPGLPVWIHERRIEAI